MTIINELLEELVNYIKANDIINYSTKEIVNDYVQKMLLNKLDTTTNLEILESLAEKQLNLPKDKIYSRQATRNYIIARQIVFYIALEKLKITSKFMERHSGFDHATVLYHRREAASQIKNNDQYIKPHYDAIAEMLRL